MRWSLLIVAAAGACSFNPSGSVDATTTGDDAHDVDGTLPDGALLDGALPDGTVPDGTLPDGTSPDSALPDGATDAPPDAACVPGCTGDLLTECTPLAMTRTCDLACLPGPTPHCAELVPSNLPDSSDLTGVTGGLAFRTGSYLLDTSTGVISDRVGNVIRPASDTTIRYRIVSTDPPIAVMAMTQLSIPAGATVFAVGRPALILLVGGSVTIAGQLDLSAGCFVGADYTRRCGGPGAGWGGNATMGAGTGCAGGGAGQGQQRRSGGAGGGFATVGGNGGAGGGNPEAMAASISNCTGATLVPLAGGGGGGAGPASGGSFGGGGGGAVQITSLTSITIASSTAVTPADVYAGGAGGKAPTSLGGAGGGAGAGGAILLEAPVVNLTQGRLTAAGGGGAGGRSTMNDGAYGRHDGVAAPGGAGDPAGGAGGAGAVDGMAAQVGDGGDFDGTGGGGGGLGKLRVNTKAGTWVAGTGSLTVGALTTGPLSLR